MFYLINKVNDNLYIFDSDDSVTECFKVSEVLNFIKNLGIKINGIKLSGNSLLFNIVRKPTINFEKLIDNSYLERTDAIAIINGKVYIEDCHQHCVDNYLLDNGSSLKESEGIDLSTDDGFEEACDYTHAKFGRCEMYGWDIFRDKQNKGYLIAHFESNFIACYDWAVEYSKSNNLLLGTYKDGTNKIYLSRLV